MDNNNLKPDLEGLPSKWFRLKLKLRLRTKWFSICTVRMFANIGMYAHKHKLKFASIVMAGVMTLSGAVGAYAYSDNSVTVLHPLYPLKKGIESAELYLAATPKDKASVHLRQAMKRLAEAEVLKDQMDKSSNPDNEKDGLEETVADMQDQMTQTLANGNDETDVKEAAELVQTIKHDFKTVNNRVQNLESKFSNQKADSVKAKLEQIKNFTEQKVVKAEQDEDDLQQIILDRPRKGLLKHLGDSEMNQDLKQGTQETSEAF